MADRKELRLFLSRTGVMIGSRVLGAGLTLVYTLLLARVTEPHQLGLAMAAISASMLLSVPVSMNIESGAIRYLIHYLTKGETAKAAAFVRTARNLVLAATPPVMVLALLAVWLLAGDRQAVWVYALAFVAVPWLALARVTGRLGMAVDQVVRGSTPRMVVRPIVFALVAAAVWLVNGQIGALHLAGLSLVCALLTWVIQSVLLRPYLGFAAHSTHDYSDRAEWIRTGIYLIPMLTMSEFMRDIIIAFSAVTLASDQVAVLVIGLSLIGILNFSLKAVDMTLSPKIAKAIANDNRTRAQRLLSVGTMTKVVGITLGIGVIYLVRYQILGLFGDHYTAAGSAFLALMIIPAATAFLGPGDMVLNVTGHRRQILIGTLSGIVLMAVLTPFGGLIGGPTGAAAGAAAAFVIQQVMLWAFCRRFAGVDPSVIGLVARARDRA